MKLNKWKIISSKYNLGMTIAQNTLILTNNSEALKFTIKNTLPYPPEKKTLIKHFKIQNFLHKSKLLCPVLNMTSFNLLIDRHFP